MRGEDGSGQRATDNGALELDRLVHDLLQSVAIVQAVGSLIRHDSRGSDWLREQVSLIERETQTIVAMCQSARSRVATSERVNLADVVETVVDRVSLVYPGTLAVESIDAFLMCNEVDWIRAVSNLVDNACRAAGDQGKVLVSVEGMDAQIRVSVGDSGPGFGEGLAGAASLGLGTVSRVVHQHGGHLELRTSPLGGAMVVIVIPDQRRSPGG